MTGPYESTPEGWERWFRWIRTAPSEVIRMRFEVIMKREFWESRFDW